MEQAVLWQLALTPKVKAECSGSWMARELWISRIMMKSWTWKEHALIMGRKSASGNIMEMLISNGTSTMSKVWGRDGDQGPMLAIRAACRCSYYDERLIDLLFTLIMFFWWFRMVSDIHCSIDVFKSFGSNAKGLFIQKIII